MSDEIRVSRPQSAPQGGMQRQDMPMQGEPMMQKSSKMPWVVLAIVVVVLVVLGVLFRGKLFSGSGSATTASSSLGYQAVFLTNGQVYFGKLSEIHSDYLNLKDIYYLQVGPQQGSQTNPATAPAQSISLVKLGNELHGPVDEMHISKAQVLFYEDLKDDGQVVTAIKNYKATPAPAPAPAK